MCKLYETSGDAGFVCRRCGISRPTLRKWWRRYLAQGIAGLKATARPKHSPATKTGPDEIALILALLTLRNLGARRIQSELKRLHSISLAIAMKWFTEFGHLNRGDMLTSEQHRCSNEKKIFQS
jgi:transposase-like protein